MKYFLFIFFAGFLSTSSYGQRFALLDTKLAQPITYSDHITQTDKFNGLFPVEKKLLPEFIKALEEISQKLGSHERIGNAKQYQIGCAKFTGLTVSLASGDRLDYVITSICGGIKISMHLSDAKSGNAMNAFFINTWIKYIKSPRK
ncbi:MAG TPA: hypothetical protein VGP55_06820 [Chitinophagaceae bacterium]|nr:hypothetical protein [Chitinophagaceae bacterium]